ncbi:HEAT repeat domain-containing protein [Sphingomonas sp. RB1R13]|uniref:HEAT repeat domain-containing protein n=1 Tax=Sphingomonas sp. RB1R13 TaxID=3096159 RepID=UPI002FC80A35
MNRYDPPSDFLKFLIEDDASLSGDDADANLRRLISLTRDEHPANRDWATLILAQQDADTSKVRQALLTAADDENEYVRAEAILGLAQRDRASALPFLQRELGGDHLALPLFEAAALVADASLIENLRAFANPSGDALMDEIATKALEACEAAQGMPD